MHRIADTNTEYRWTFPARGLRAVDGDTIDVIIDQGMHNQRHERLRLLGVNTPERKGATRGAGDAAWMFTENWLAVHSGTHLKIWEPEWPLRIETHKADAFGRYLARVCCADCGDCLNEKLIESGNAVVDIR